MQGGALFEFFRWVLAAMRRLGWPKAAARLTPREADGYAVAIAYMLKARWWTFAHTEPRWPELQLRWTDAEERVGVRSALEGRLDPADRLRLIASGQEGFAERDALYAAATKSIDIATYYIQSDETGRATVRALSQCVARGVRVRLLVDRYMMFKKTREVEGMAELALEITAAGIEMRAWHDTARPYDSNHRKMILVDGRAALVGGRNFADHYRGDEWRDVDLVVEGPTVEPLGALFERLWKGDAVRAAQVHAPWIEAMPDRVLDDPLMRFAISAIGAATRSVDLELAYFCAHDSLCGALERAARRGVRVRVLTNSAETNDLPYATWTAYEAIRRVLEGGCEVLVRRGAGRTLHPKYLVVDGESVSFGSHNLDYYSARYCGEVNLVVRDAGLGEQLAAFFETGLSDATPIDLEREVRPFLASHGSLRLFDRVFRDFQ